MFDLYITKEVESYIRTIKKELRKKGYRECISTTNRHIGGLYLSYKTSDFIKDNIIFEFQVDKVNNTISTRLWIKDDKLESKEIMLADVLELA